jgi:hypothetical protein
MKKSKILLSSLICLLIFGVSCKKDIAPINAEESTSNLGPIVKKASIVNPGYTEYSLTDNGDGTLSGQIFGADVTLSNINYELFYDANGNMLPPKEGDPFYANINWSGSESYTWSLILSPSAPNNQFVIQVATYYTTIYSIGSKLDEYYAAMDAYRNNYVTSWNISVQPGYSVPGYYTFPTTWYFNSSTVYRPPYFPPLLTNYLNKTNTGQGGNRLITGYLIRKSDGSFALRINDIPLS